MSSPSSIALAPLFQAVGEVLRRNQSALNQADSLNGNHGDHMVDIFEKAAQAVQEKQIDGLAEALVYAASLLDDLKGNGSAKMYADGLRQLAEQMRRSDISLEQLVAYVREALAEGNQSALAEALSPARSGDILKALLRGLSNWSQVEQGKPTSSGLDMGALFEFGMAYWHAKQRGGERVAVLADAAASVSPLSKVAHRYESGRLAIEALLQAMQLEP